MTKRHLTLFAVIILALTLMLSLSGCSGDEDVFEGKCTITFEFNGGMLRTKTSSVKDKIKYAYVMGTKIIDIQDIDGYSFSKSGYDFVGWYTHESCEPQYEWDFDSFIETENLTLYAGWKKSIVYSYTLYYVDDNSNEVSLGSYTVDAGKEFKDWREFANNRENYTPTGFYSDKDLETPWDDTTVHPGGESDCDIPVYVKYIKGEWELVNNISDFKKAISAGKNIYLTADIDCENATLSLGEYSATLEGNGYSIKNFKVLKSNQAYRPKCAIFDRLSDGAQIKNVNFENVNYDMTGIDQIKIQELKFALLAVEAGEVTVENVNVTGTAITDYTGELPKAESAFFTTEMEEPTGFTSSVTVERVGAPQAD